MNNKDISKEWFKMAELDLDSAKFLLGMKTTTYRNNMLSLSTKCREVFERVYSI
jgi:hypothetical protein